MDWENFRGRPVDHALRRPLDGNAPCERCAPMRFPVRLSHGVGTFPRVLAAVSGRTANTRVISEGPVNVDELRGKCTVVRLSVYEIP